MMYLSIDGDNIGFLLDRSFILNDLLRLQTTSDQVRTEIESLTKQLRDIGMKILFSTGDNILCSAETIDVNKILDLLKSSDVSFSAAIGYSLRDVYMSLRYAKSTGKGKLVYMFPENTFREYIVKPTQ